MLRYLTFLLLFLLLFQSVEAEQLDIGLYESSQPNKLEVRIRPDYNIAFNAITSLSFTIRYENAGNDLTLFPLLPVVSYPPLVDEGFYYQPFVLNGIYYANSWTAGNEYLVAYVEYDPALAACEVYELINNDFTNATNISYYVSVQGVNKTGQIYQPIVTNGSYGGSITGSDVVFFAESTGPMMLENYNGDVVEWQRNVNASGWQSIPGTAGLDIFEETPGQMGNYIYKTLVEKPGCAVVESDPFAVEVVTKVTLIPKIFLEGPYDQGLMKFDLLNKGLLPSTQPFNSFPWGYDGLENVGAFPSPNVVDWVLVELRQTAGDVSTALDDMRVARKACLLLNNGQVVAIDGNPVELNLAVTDNLYLVIWHRNHLPLISNNALSGFNFSYSYDFTDSPAKAYGGTDALKELSSGVYGMIGGDCSLNGEITSGDQILNWAGQAGTTGYLNSDINLDGEVNLKDKNDFIYFNLGQSSQLPD